MKQSTKFQKGNTVARDAAARNRKKKQEAKLVLNETDMLQAKIYNESLKQILEKLENQELSSADLIRVNSTVAEFVNPKVKAGRPKKKDPKADIDNLLDALGYEG